jgi:hypothetical protein
LKRVTLLACFALAAFVMAAPALAREDKPVFDKVSGLIGFGNQTVEMYAGNTLAHGVRGEWSLTSPGFSANGSVTELIVDGNKATACGTIEASSDPSLVGDTFQQYVNDTGGAGQFDRSQTFFYAAGTPCIAPSVYDANGAGLLNTAGQWHVHDAP